MATKIKKDKRARELTPGEAQALNEQMLVEGVESARLNLMMAKLKLECGVNATAIINSNFQWVLPTTGQRLLGGEVCPTVTDGHQA